MLEDTQHPRRQTHILTLTCIQTFTHANTLPKIVSHRHKYKRTCTCVYRLYHAYTCVRVYIHIFPYTPTWLYHCHLAKAPSTHTHTQSCRHPSLSGEEEERHGCCRQRQDSSVAAPERRVANRSHYSWTRITGPVGRASARQGRAGGTRTTHHQGPQLGASSPRPHQLLPLSDPHSAILHIISLLSSHIVSRLNPHQSATLSPAAPHTHARIYMCTRYTTMYG